MTESKAEHHLRNLLAIVHHDGGHYVSRYGLEKATEDAIQAWCDRSVQIDALEARLEMMERVVENAAYVIEALQNDASIRVPNHVRYYENAMDALAAQQEPE